MLLEQQNCNSTWWTPAEKPNTSGCLHWDLTRCQGRLTQYPSKHRLSKGSLQYSGGYHISGLTRHRYLFERVYIKPPVVRTVFSPTIRINTRIGASRPTQTTQICHFTLFTYLQLRFSFFEIVLTFFFNFVVFIVIIICLFSCSATRITITKCKISTN